MPPVQQYQEAKAQLDGYKLLLDQGRQTLEAAKQEAQQKFEETEGQLVGAKKELDDGWLQLDSAKAELAQAKLELETGGGSWRKTRKRWTTPSFRSTTVKSSWKKAKLNT